jgi:predicted nucleic acid-binding protein
MGEEIFVMNAKSPGPVVGLALLDNTILSNFSIADCAELLTRAWTYPATTQHVMQEYQAGVSSGELKQETWAGINLLSMTLEEQDFVAGLPAYLGLGERSCLAVSYYRHGILVTDDIRARQVAITLRIVVSGTLGALILCVKRNLIDLEQANHLLARMIAAGYRSPLSELKP